MNKFTHTRGIFNEAPALSRVSYHRYCKSLPIIAVQHSPSRTRLPPILQPRPQLKVLLPIHQAPWRKVLVAHAPSCSGRNTKGSSLVQPAIARGEKVAKHGAREHHGELCKRAVTNTAMGLHSAHAYLNQPAVGKTRLPKYRDASEGHDDDHGAHNSNDNNMRLPAQQSEFIFHRCAFQLVLLRKERASQCGHTAENNTTAYSDLPPERLAYHVQEPAFQAARAYREQHGWNCHIGEWRAIGGSFGLGNPHRKGHTKDRSHPDAGEPALHTVVCRSLSCRFYDAVQCCIQNLTELMPLYIRVSKRYSHLLVSNILANMHPATLLT